MTTPACGGTLCLPREQGSMRAIQKLVARLDAGEPIVVGAVGGSVTAAHGALVLFSLVP